MNVGEFELVQALDLILPLMRVGETCRIEVNQFKKQTRTLFKIYGIKKIVFFHNFYAES